MLLLNPTRRDDSGSPDLEGELATDGDDPVHNGAKEKDTLAVMRGDKISNTLDGQQDVPYNIGTGAARCLGRLEGDERMIKISGRVRGCSVAVGKAPKSSAV